VRRLSRQTRTFGQLLQFLAQTAGRGPRHVVGAPGRQVLLRALAVVRLLRLGLRLGLGLGLGLSCLELRDKALRGAHADVGAQRGRARRSEADVRELSQASHLGWGNAKTTENRKEILDGAEKEGEIRRRKESAK